MPKPQGSLSDATTYSLTARELAFELLLPFARIEAEAPKQNVEAVPKLNETLHQAFEENPQLSPEDRAFLNSLVMGTLRWWFPLGALIAQQGKKPVTKLDVEVATLLRLGAFQLLLQESVPDYAALSSTLALASKARVSVHAKGFMTALLRQWQRHYPEKAKRKALLDSLPLKAHCPPWLWNAMNDALTPEALRNLLFDAKEQAPFGLRATVPEEQRPVWLEAMAQQGYSLSQPNPQQVPEFYFLQPATGRLPNLPGYKEGWLYAQDYNSACIAPLLEVKPGQVVVDACAAPGSKATHIGWRLQGEGHVFALDASAKRLERLKDNWQRLNLSDTLLTVLAQPFEVWASHQATHFADRLLLDAPCSGTGTLKRHPDLWFRLTPKVLAAYPQKQLNLLKAAWPLLKPGGRLLYSTCSVYLHENRKVAEAFAQSLPEGSFKLLQQEQRWPSSQQDGFFMALFEKV